MSRRHNLRDVSVDIPLCVLTAVTGVSGSGKSTLVSQVLAEDPTALESFDRLVLVDQRPIGRTPRSNLATYTGMFDAVRKLYAATDEARARGYGAGRFSFNVAEGRCETCQGEGFVAVELLFLPGTYAPCPTCHGARYNAETLEITYRDKNIAEVLALSVDEAATFLADVPAAARSLETLRDVGLGYLRLGQPATELSGGEAQRIKLATELQRARRGHALYLLDEPTSGLHPADTALLLRQLHRLVDAGNTVVLVEHDLDAIATADWVIDLGPGGGDAGGRVVATGTPADVAKVEEQCDRAVPRAAARRDLSRADSEPVGASQALGPPVRVVHSGTTVQRAAGQRADLGRLEAAEPARRPRPDLARAVPAVEGGGALGVRREHAGRLDAVGHRVVGVAVEVLGGQRQPQRPGVVAGGVDHDRGQLGVVGPRAPVEVVGADRRPGVVDDAGLGVHVDRRARVVLDAVDRRPGPARRRAMSSIARRRPSSCGGPAEPRRRRGAAARRR